MKKLLFLTFFSLILISCGGAGFTIQSHSQAMELSKKGELVLFDGVIYKDGYAYGKYSVTEPEIQHKIVTYRTMEGSDVATLVLKGVAPESAPLKLSTGEDVTLKMREFEIEVTEKDGAIYLIENMILKRSVVKKDIVSTKESVSDEKKEAEQRLEINTDERVDTGVSVKRSGKSKDNINLLYRFKKGDRYSYRAQDETEMKISMGKMAGMDMGGMGDMGGMMKGSGLSQKFLSDTKFHFDITSVKKDGSANFTMYVDRFSVYLMPSKTLIASEKGINTKDLKVKGVITKKGEVKFLEEIYVVVTENNERVLVSGKVSKNGNRASGTVNNGDEEVTVYAEFDPKTGTVKGGVKTKKLKRRKVKKKIKVTQKDKRVDILPKKFMELFRLPDGNLSIGEKVDVKMPMFNISFSVEKHEKGIAYAGVEFKTDMKDIKKMGGDDQAVSMMPKMSGDMSVQFNTEKGFLKAISGEMKTSMNAGMKMEITSKLKMTKE